MPLSRSAPSCLALIVAALSPALARADDAPAKPAPDKSGYTWSRPTPDADLRTLCTDRPTKSTSPCTVDAGHVQIESDVFNATFDRSGGVDTDTYLYTNPTLKLGLTNTVDVELNIAPYQVVTTRVRATGATARAEGIGDLFARLKVNLLGDDGGDVAFAVVPYVKAPTARTGVGNRATEGGLIAPLSVNLPMNWSVVIDPEVDSLKNAAGGGHHTNVSALVSLSKPASKTVTLSAELWSDVNYDPSGTVRQVSADFGAAWIPAAAPNLQWDGGINIGLNNVTPGIQAYVGVSRRF